MNPQATPRGHTFTHDTKFHSSIFANQGLAKAGKPRIARKGCAKITTRRKTAEWSALEKPVAPLPSPPPAGKISLSGAGEGIRTPDPLITNQMLYRLSYASNARDNRAFAQTYPSDPFKMSGTIS